MKKLSFNAFALSTVILFAVSSCKKNDSSIAASTNDANTSEVFLNEGYNPTSTGKTIRAFYAGRDVDLVEIENGKYLYDGDVVLERKDFAIAGEPNSEGVYSGRTWANRSVRWQFASGVSQDLKNKWTAATQAWSRDLGFRFTQITAGSGDYILVQQNSNGSAYSNSIGRRGGQQIISVDPSRFSAGSVIHEIGHAVGLIHEQKRPDRDSYIRVNYSNIRPNWTSQYDKCSGCTRNGTFDFGSIMLYGARASSTVVVNPNIPAMTKLDGTTWTTNRTNLSTGDKAAINTMYR